MNVLIQTHAKSVFDRQSKVSPTRAFFNASMFPIHPLIHSIGQLHFCTGICYLSSSFHPSSEYYYPFIHQSSVHLTGFVAAAQQAAMHALRSHADFSMVGDALRRNDGISPQINQIKYVFLLAVSGRWSAGCCWPFVLLLQ